MNRTAENDNLTVLQWLHANRSDGCTTDAINLTVGNGHLYVVEWLHANRSEGFTIDQLGIATWLLLSGCMPICLRAAPHLP